MKHSDKAISLFRNGHNCAQSVLTAHSEAIQLDENLARDIASGFGAGIGHTQKTCGAVTGAIMAIGVACSDKQKSYAMSEEFLYRFEKRFGASDCLSILGADMRTERGQEKIARENLYSTVCEKYIRTACELLEGLDIL